LPERQRCRSGKGRPVTVHPLVASIAGELGCWPAPIFRTNSRLSRKSAVFARTGATDERAGCIVGIDVEGSADVHVLPTGEHFTLERDAAGLRC